MKRMFALYNLIVWLVFEVASFAVIGVFVQSLIRDLRAGKEIFYPGIAVLFLLASIFAVFSATRIRKYFLRLRA